MLLELFRIIIGVVSAAIVIALTGAVVGRLLAILSRRFIGRRLEWLLGNLSATESFALGLMLMTFVVAALYAWFGGGSMSHAWFRYAAGAGIAFYTFLVVSRHRRPRSGA